MDRYGLDMTLSPEQSSDEEEFDDTDHKSEIRPKSLLDSAVRKRFELNKTEGENLRCEMLQTRFIVQLHRHIENKKKNRKRLSSTNGTSSDSRSDDEEPMQKRKSIGKEEKGKENG